MLKVFKLETFNVRGLTDEHQLDLLNKDPKMYELDLCCLQETKINTELDVNLTNSHLINFKPDCNSYGCSYIISEEWQIEFTRLGKFLTEYPSSN